MDIILQGVVTLLKSAVTQKKFILPDGFDISRAEPQIKAHQIVSMVYDGAVRCGISPEHPTMQSLFQGYCKALQTSERQEKAIERIYAAFEAEGIEYMPLKGCIMKSLYPKPEMRMMGDADILIRVAQYPRIVPMMEALGFRAGEETGHDYGWLSESLHLELHKCLLPPEQRDFYAYFGDGWAFAKPENGSRYAMFVEDSFIYIFAHFTKHYRNLGIGCRHMADLWVYLQAHPEMDEAYLKGKLEELHLWTFYQNTLRTLKCWFEDGPSDEITEHISEVIFANGCWGTSENATTSWVIRNKPKTQNTAGIRMIYVVKRFFPGLEEMSWKYPLLKKAPYLLPAAWVIRLMEKLLLSSKPVRRQMKMLSMMTEDQVELRRQMLRFVGLDDRF